MAAIGSTGRTPNGQFAASRLANAVTLAVPVVSRATHVPNASYQGTWAHCDQQGIDNALLVTARASSEDTNTTPRSIRQPKTPLMALHLQI